MNSPANKQQESKDESLNSMIADAFDELDKGDDSEEMEISSEDGEEASFEDEGGKEESAQPDGELKEEIQDAADGDYQEPAPERWPEEIKTVYNSLPPNARKAMLEGIYKPMQRSYTQATQEMAALRNQITPVLESMSQYAQDFERAGVNPIDAFRTQMAWAAHFQRVGAEQGLKDMASAYKVGSTEQGQQSNQYLTPTERAMQAQIAQLQKQISGTNESLKTRDRMATYQAQRHEIESTLQNFVNEKAEDGTPKHPYMDKVAANIAGFIRGGMIAKADEYGNAVPLRDQIAKAYKMACDLDPSIRAPGISARQAGRINAAQRTGVVTRHPASKQDTEDMDMSTFIEKTYDQLASRKS